MWRELTRRAYEIWQCFCLSFNLIWSVRLALRAAYSSGPWQQRSYKDFMPSTYFLRLSHSNFVPLGGVCTLTSRLEKCQLYRGYNPISPSGGKGSHHCSISALVSGHHSRSGPPLKWKHLRRTSGVNCSR